MPKYQKPKCPICQGEDFLEFQEFIYTTYRKIGKSGKSIGKFRRQRFVPDGQNACGIKCISCGEILSGDFDENDRLIDVGY